MLPEERTALERDVQEQIRTIRLALDDLAAAVERLRQIRVTEHTVSDRLLMIEVGPCGRPEVVW